jgi:hypothetical protein
MTRLARRSVKKRHVRLTVSNKTVLTSRAIATS